MSSINASRIAIEKRPADRIRILHVIPRLGVGGTEHGLMKIMNGLAEEEFEQRICAVRGLDAAFAGQMKITNKTYRVDTESPGLQFPLFRMARIMRDFRPHIVHTRNFGAVEGIAAALLARIPVSIHSEHGYELEIMEGLPFRRRALCHALFAMTDAVFTVSRDLRDYHAKQSWIAPKKIAIVHNGVNTEKFAPCREGASEIRRALGIPPERMIVGSVGRLVPIKDHATLLRATELLVRRGKDIHVLLVGAGPEEAKLREQALASPQLAARTTFTGASESVPQLLNAMDIFVLSSINEGMSNTLLEAMACGLSVVATRVGGNTELAEEGRSAHLFAPQDVETLSAILERLVSSPELRSELGKEARKRVVEQFSLVGMIEQYRNLYFRLASLGGIRKRG